MARGPAAVAVAVAIAVAIAAPAAWARPPLELHARRGVGGVVAAGGIDVIEIEVVSAADVAMTVEVEIDHGRYPLALAVRGRGVVTVARRVPPGVATLAAIAIRAVTAGGAIEAEVSAIAVVARPVVVVTDDPAAAVPALEPWRRSAGLGEPVAIAVEAVPRRWQALVGVGALVIDRPVTGFAPEAARQIRRHLASGGQVCRLAPPAAAPGCARAAAVAVPRTAQAGSIAATTRALGAVAVAVAVGLGLAAALRRRRGVAVAVAFVALGVGVVAPAAWSPGAELAIRGVRAPAVADEDWVAAELGASDLAGRIELGGDLWIEPSAPADPAAALDDRGLAGRVPGPGRWRVRGFVAAGVGGWTRPLTRSPRPVPEVP